MSKDTTVVPFPGTRTQGDAGAGTVEAPQGDPAQLASELAIVTEELSLRISGNSGKPLTQLQIKNYQQRITHSRALIAQLEVAVSTLTPDC